MFRCTDVAKIDHGEIYLRGRLTDQINFEVQEAYEQARKGAKTLALFTATILPAAERNVEAAETAYAKGKTPFLSLVESQRSLIGWRDRYYETQADYLRRRAALERVTGGPPAALDAPSGNGPNISCPPR